MTGMPHKHDWRLGTDKSMLITPRHIRVISMLLHEQTMISPIAAHTFMLLFYAFISCFSGVGHDKGK
jgi:hypothetical protein